MLDDVRINLETLGEQKAVIDHVAEKVAQLEFTLQEARNTLRTLQHERELAERIEQGIKQLRSKTTQAEERQEARLARRRSRTLTERLSPSVSVTFVAPATSDSVNPHLVGEIGLFEDAAIRSPRRSSRPAAGRAVSPCRRVRARRPR